MQAHAHDLRSELAKDWNTLTEEAPPAEIAALDAFVHQVVEDWRLCPLTLSVQRLLDFAERLTRAPSTLAESDIADLRTAGWSDAAIHDAVQTIAYFNYINRVADGLGVDAESFLPKWGRTGGPGSLNLGESIGE